MSHPLVYVAPDADALFEQCEARLDRLRAEGFDVVVAAPQSHGLEAFAYHGFDVRPLPGRSQWNVAGWIGAYLILQADFLERRPTLVHGFGVPWAWIASFAAHRSDVPGIVATVESHDLERPDHLLSNLLSRLPDAILERAPDAASAYRILGRWVHTYVVHHEEDLQALVDAGAVPGSKLELLLGGRGVDLSRFDFRDEALPDTNGVRKILEVPGGVRTLIGVSEPWNRETIGLVRDLQRRMARTHPGVGWLIHGTDRVPGTFSPDAGVEFHRAIDLLLNVDVSDAHGLDLMRAAAMRTAVVAVDSPAARSIVVDHETGRVAIPDDVGDALVQVLADPKRLADMGIRAGARAEQRFDRRQIDQQILTLYDRILSRVLR